MFRLFDWFVFLFCSFVHLFVCSLVSLLVRPSLQGHPAKPEAQQARSEAQPASSVAQPARSEAQPARSEAQPARSEAKPARSERTDEQKISPFYRTLSPIGAAALPLPMKTKEKVEQGKGFL